MGFSPSQPDGSNDSLQSAVSPDGSPTLETQYRVPGRCGVAVKVAKGQTIEVQNTTLQINRQKIEKQRTRKITVAMGMFDRDEQPSKFRRIESQDRKEGTISLPTKIYPNLEGIIHLDYAIWKDLKSDHRNFVRNYNKSVRHDDKEEPQTPPNVRIMEKKEQQWARGCSERGS